jgi:hypothetical protein
LKVLTMNSLEETYENHEKPVIIAGRPAEIWTEHVPYTNAEL